MLEETQPLLDSCNDSNENENPKDMQGLCCSIKYYLHQPKTWDWIIVGVIICMIIATIVLVA
jgi:hypothetical protein